MSNWNREWCGKHFSSSTTSTAGYLTSVPSFISIIFIAYPFKLTIITLQPLSLFLSSSLYPSYSNISLFDIDFIFQSFFCHVSLIFQSIDIIVDISLPLFSSVNIFFSLMSGCFFLFRIQSFECIREVYVPPEEHPEAFLPQVRLWWKRESWQARALCRICRSR